MEKCNVDTYIKIANSIKMRVSLRCPPYIRTIEDTENIRIWNYNDILSPAYETDNQYMTEYRALYKHKRYAGQFVICPYPTYDDNLELFVTGSRCYAKEMQEYIEDMTGETFDLFLEEQDENLEN